MTTMVYLEAISFDNESSTTAEKILLRLTKGGIFLLTLVVQRISSTHSFLKVFNSVEAFYF